MEKVKISSSLSKRASEMLKRFEPTQKNVKNLTSQLEPFIPHHIHETKVCIPAKLTLWPSQIAKLTIILCILAFITWTIYIRYFHLSRIPGPFWAAYTRLWLSKTLASGESAKVFVDINKRYGPLARIGPNNLITDDPEVARSILAARSHYTRGPWFDSIRIDPHVANIVSERHTGKHNHLRHQMRAGYTGKEIEGTEQVIDARIADFMNRISSKWLSTPHQPTNFDIGQRIQFLALDVITHLCFGAPLGFMTQDRDVSDFVRTIEQQLPIVQHFSVFLEFNWLLKNLTRISLIKRLLLPRNTDTTGIGKIMGITQSVAGARFKPGAVQKKDMMGSFIKHGLSASEVEAEISISLVAGSDTTATSMRATLLAIITNPIAYSKLRAEISQGIRNGAISEPITDAESRKMPYLQACILEGLRRFPPITQLRERIVPPEGDMIHGYEIPGGTYIGLNAWGLQLNPVFGEDAHVFRPERWLEADPAQLAAMMRVWELIFGHGNTKCLGQGIAFMVLNKIFVELFRRFDISIVDPHRPWKSTCYGIFFQKDFFVRVSRSGIGSI
ncbi:cytochrome P450 oxidoreductase [Massarina eburnea CBS 473.64]|uniref:Cytochrome P450 oxidoreductase n=1 Tax=Massarina eburnea CBS 473.64 TaxID=1395130 RepID=A0A6A6RKB5_9PLEO|nr:cytochrome P450 oxidoreductase [Massarina eburnea CBS 473.64]